MKLCRKVVITSLNYISVDTVADKCLVENGYVDWDDSDEAVLPLKLIKLLEKKDFWRKRSFVGVNERTAQVLYAKIHQDPVLYRNLYHYIVYRQVVVLVVLKYFQSTMSSPLMLNAS